MVKFLVSSPQGPHVLFLISVRWHSSAHLTKTIERVISILLFNQKESSNCIIKNKRV